MIHADSLRLFGATTVALTANLLFLWTASGAVRARTGKKVNSEDAVKPGQDVWEQDPPAVARVLRAHANAQAAILPFLLLGSVYVLGGGTFVVAAVLFPGFIAARTLHSVAYLKALQPWRTIGFGLGLLVTLVLMGFDSWLLLR